jgi:ribosomal protein L28
VKSPADAPTSATGSAAAALPSRSKRKFKANIQMVRVLDPDGRVLRLKLSTRAIKTGVVTLKKGDRTISFPLVRALRGRNREFTKAQRREA